MKFNKAGSKVERMAKLLIKECFPHLKEVRILYSMRAKPKPGEDSTIVAGEARVLPAKLQDLWGYQAEIELARPVWETLTPSGKNRLLWHELRHLQVSLDDDDKPDLDKDGRVSMYCDDHDIRVTAFYGELVRFGPTKNDLKVMKKMYLAYKKFKSGKLKVAKKLTFEDKEVSFG